MCTRMISSGVKHQGMKLTIHFHLVPLRMCAVMPTLPHMSAWYIAQLHTRDFIALTFLLCNHNRWSWACCTTARARILYTAVIGLIDRDDTDTAFLWNVGF
jgi:hypothetical protein